MPLRAVIEREHLRRCRFQRTEGGAYLPAPLRRHDHPFWQGHRAAYLRGGRPDRSRDAPPHCISRSIRHEGDRSSSSTSRSIS